MNALVKMDAKTIDYSVKSFMDRALKEMPDKIREIYLFGSCARGDYDEESDIDVFVVVDCSKDDVLQCRRKLADISADVGLANDVILSITLSGQQEWEKYKDFLLLYRDILREGKCYYGKTLH